MIGPLVLPCAPTEKAIEAITKHDERLVGIGITHVNTAVGVYAGEDGNFTIALQLPDGRLCVVALGTDWSVLPLGKPL